MFCQKCGTKAIDGAEFCQKCGTRLIADAPTEQPAAVQAAPARQPTPAQTNTAEKKKSKLPVIIGAVAAVVVLAIVFVVLNWEGKTDYVATVRAYEPFSSSQGLPYTCGEVFDKYIPNAEWDVRKSGDEGYVDITGTAKGTDKTLVITIEVSVDSNDFASIVPVQISVDDEKTSAQNEVDTFFLSFFVAYDEKLEDLSNFDILASEVESVLQGSGSSSEQPHDTPTTPVIADQLLLCEIPVEDIMGADPDDIIAAFGEPVTQSEHSLEYGVDEWEGFTEDGWMCFYLDDAGQVEDFDADPVNFTYGGQNLMQDSDTLVAIFGRDYKNLGASTYIWQVAWDYRDYQVIFTFPRNAEEIPYSIYVTTPTPDDLIDDYTYFEDDSTYSNLDSSLVGRWRAYDGGSVEFSEYGEATVSFSPHGSLLFHDYMTWEAYDGRIILSSHFSDTSTWLLTDYSDSMQILTLNTNSVVTSYTRSEPSTSLVGTWDKVGDGYTSKGALVLYSDGTGTMEKVTSSVTFNMEHVPISWWSDDTNLYINWTLLSAYDYTVSGDTLTIFFSNGSRVYTKVGG